MSEMKNKLDNINNRLDIIKEKISEFKDVAIEINQKETQRVNENKKTGTGHQRLCYHQCIF